MKNEFKKLTVLSLALTMAFSASLSACAEPTASSENETPILKIDDGEVSVHSDKIPADLKEAMDKAGENDLIGKNGTFGKTPSLVMFIDLPSGVPDVEHWLETEFLDNTLEKYGVPFNRVERVGDVYYYRESPDVPYAPGQYQDQQPIPKMPDGSDFMRAFYYSDVFEWGGAYSDILHRGIINLSLTKSEILKLCEDETVICFEYGEEADTYTYYTQYVYYDSGDALTILRASLDTYVLTGRFYDLDGDWKCTSNDAVLALRASVEDDWVMFDHINREWSPTPPLRDYGISFQGEGYMTVSDIVNDSEVILTGHVDDIDFEEVTPETKSLRRGLKNDIADKNSAYAELLTNYTLSNVEVHKGLPKGMKDGKLTISVYGGRGNYAGEEPYYEKQAAVAGEYRYLPHLFNGVFQPSHDKIDLGGDYVFLLKYDEGSGRWTLRNVIHSVYSTDPESKHYWGEDSVTNADSILNFCIQPTYEEPTPIND